MQFGAADAINLCSAFRAGSINNSAAAFVKISSGILYLTFGLAFYTITFHFFLHTFMYWPEYISVFLILSQENEKLLRNLFEPDLLLNVTPP